MATLDEDDYARIELIVKAETAGLRRDIDRHERILSGNGRAGLVADFYAMKRGRPKFQVSVAGIAAVAAAIATAVVQVVYPAIPK